MSLWDTPRGLFWQWLVATRTTYRKQLAAQELQAAALERLAEAAERIAAALEPTDRGEEVE
jgi:hypothetical protein